jgi:hypothetical protein
LPWGRGRLGIRTPVWRQTSHSCISSKCRCAARKRNLTTRFAISRDLQKLSVHDHVQAAPLHILTCVSRFLVAIAINDEQADASRMPVRSRPCIRQREADGKIPGAAKQAYLRERSVSGCRRRSHRARVSNTTEKNHPIVASDFDNACKPPQFRPARRSAR